MKKIDQHIKEKLSQPQLPPLDAWKNIQDKLDKKEDKKRIIPLFYWIGSTAACVILGVGVYYFNQNDRINNQLIPSQEIVKKGANSNSKNDLEKIDNKNIKGSNSIQNQIESTTVSNNINHINNSSSGNNLFSLKNYTTDNSINSNDNITFNKIVNNSFSQTNNSQELTSNQSIFDDFINRQKNNHSENNSVQKINEKEIEVTTLNEEKPLELVLEEEKKKTEEKIDVKKSAPIFAVSSFVNPSKMLDSRSILSDGFNGNSIQNNIAMTYGAKVSIKLNDKMNLRSGIAKVDLEQQTNNVSTAVTTGIYMLSSVNTRVSNQNNINYNSNIRVVGQSDQPMAMSTMLSSDENQLEQKLQYIEIPLEVEYKLAQFNKFNLLATAGGSYYMVTKNSIGLNDINAKNSYTIGKASNVNNSSYSANAGVKLEYNLSNKSSINLEPNYRYLINPLQNVDAKNPSLLGLNLGFSIKF